MVPDLPVGAALSPVDGGTFSITPAETASRIDAGRSRINQGEMIVGSLRDERGKKVSG
jgi:hypothetical protein